MVGVLVDACGWAALVDAELNLDDAMKGVVGQAELMVRMRASRTRSVVATEEGAPPQFARESFRESSRP
jgi:hypothetical protein